jgi:Fe2+ transport system protein FeoA
MFKTEISEKIKEMSLCEILNNHSYKVISIPSGDMRSQLLRFGLFEGQSVKCLSKLPGGTIVIELNRQEIAIGEGLAKKIFVGSN